MKRNYAIVIPEDGAITRIPGWDGSSVKVLCAPCMGANFVEYLIESARNAGVSVPSRDRPEYLFYVLSGEGVLLKEAEEYHLEKGSYGYIPPRTAWKMWGSLEKDPMRFLLVKKAYEPIESRLPEFIVGLDQETPERKVADGRAIKDFVPWREDILYDLSWFILYFEPGTGFSLAENHLHEHGLYMLSGNSLYFLDETWYHTRPGDFIWMGPYVPQSCKWYGEERGAYILYSNRNRDPEV